MELSILRHYRQTPPNKIIKIKVRAKTISIPESHEFIRYLADLKGSFCIFDDSLSYTYI